jgi:hypothetical protein
LEVVGWEAVGLVAGSSSKYYSTNKSTASSQTLVALRHLTLDSHPPRILSITGWKEGREKRAMALVLLQLLHEKEKANNSLGVIQRGDRGVEDAR